MDAARNTADEQAARWNGPAGSAWVDKQAVMEELLRPIEDLLLDGLDVGPGARVLDVGCGTGSTTLAVARRLGARAVGIDVSEPMIAAARERVERDGSELAEAAVSFVRGDAADHVFTEAAFDAVVSRFGVMFFTDPVAAFANLRHAATPQGRLRFVAWRGVAENPFTTTAERAAAPLLPGIPAREPDAPGQFAFADADRVHRILDASGWTGIDIRPVDVPCTLPTTELVGYFTRFGPLGMVLPQADERTRARVVDTVRAAFEPYVHGPEVRFTAACWMVGAAAS
ncbi:MAG TPA: methyltransferase domain-containing protein [Yinghuangia sp.]|nr:methyltransferase domain-containing protein [Yinghuangia sp.]